MFHEYFLNTTLYLRISSFLIFYLLSLCAVIPKKDTPLQKINIFRGQLSVSQPVKESQNKYYDIYNNLVSRMLSIYF
jgi:hypothetical protein